MKAKPIDRERVDRRDDWFKSRHALLNYRVSSATLTGIEVSALRVGGRVRRIVASALMLLLLLGTLPAQLGASESNCACCHSMRACPCCKARRAHSSLPGFEVERQGCDRECACTVHSNACGLDVRQAQVSFITISQRLHADWIQPGFRPSPLLAISGRAPPAPSPNLI